MRIAYLSTDRGIPYGGRKGASIHVAEMTAALAAEGAEVLLLVADIAPEAESLPGVVVEEIPQRADAAWLTRRVAEFSPAALYERYALMGIEGGRVARTLDIPHIVELNAPLVEEAFRYRRLDEPLTALRLERETLSSADVVLAVSPPLADYAKKTGARRVEVAQNAADLDKFRNVSPQRVRPRAVFAGSLRPWHGVETISAAWRILGSAAPPLVVVGDGPAREVLADVAIEMTGAVAAEEMPALLADMDIGLAPYGRDTPRYFSPIKIFEYLAAGLAVVAGDLPAVSSLLTGGEGVVIPAGDAEALADAVERLAASRVERKRLGRSGRELIAAGNTWRHRAHRVAQLVEELAPAGAAA